MALELAGPSPTYQGLRLALSAQLGRFLEPEEARAESFLWLEDGLGRSRAFLAAHGDDPVSAEERARVEGWLRRRETGEPWAYILGWTEWRGRRFEVGPATLIPRPETELVLEAALDIGRRLHVQRAVDIGTGTGILGISLALETEWAVTATDISEGALELARRNALALGARLEFVKGHLLDPVEGPLGLVVSNPPYVDPADRPTLQRELGWEPDSALFADDQGMALATELLREARRRAAPACVLEIGAGQGVPLMERALGMGWKRTCVHQDLVGHDRVMMAIA